MPEKTPSGVHAISQQSDEYDGDDVCLFFPVLTVSAPRQQQRTHMNRAVYVYTALHMNNYIDTTMLQFALENIIIIK